MKFASRIDQRAWDERWWSFRPARMRAVVERFARGRTCLATFYHGDSYEEFLFEDGDRLRVTRRGRVLR